MQSEKQQELIEAFSEIRSIGQDYADKINAWNESNIDEEKNIGQITPDMSGDAVVLTYTENGIDEDVVVQMIEASGFSLSEDSDDTVIPDSENQTTKDVSEWLNIFLMQCVEVANAYPYFVKEIGLQSGNSQHKEEVRIVIPSDADFRKLPSQNARKILFLHFLRDIREKAAKYSMTDEALCFCASKKEFWMVLRPIGNSKTR